VRAQYRPVKPGLAASLSALLAVCAQAQLPEDDARLRAAESAALAGICAYVRPGDALSARCGLGPERARTLAEELAATDALARAEGLAPEARQRALAEVVARYRAKEAARPRPKPTPTDRDRILIAPPGFGPDPSRPLKSDGR